jgi:hypothetical protein
MAEAYPRRNRLSEGLLEALLSGHSIEPLLAEVHEHWRSLFFPFAGESCVILHWCERCSFGPNSGFEIFVPGRQDGLSQSSWIQERLSRLSAPSHTTVLVRACIDHKFLSNSTP